MVMQPHKIVFSSFAQEPQFYSFIRSLKAYESSFEGSDNMMILKPTVISSALCKRQRNKQEIMRSKVRLEITAFLLLNL